MAVLLLAVAVDAGAQPATTAEDLDVRPAMAAATEWLGLVDAGRFADSWQEAAAPIREAVTRPQWEKALVQARAALGAFVSRKVMSATYTRRLPDAPPGEYVVIQYQSRYENRPIATETVTPAREADGRWRVSGYAIR